MNNVFEKLNGSVKKKKFLWKIILDFFLSSTAIVLLVPVFLFIGIIIKLTSRGPVFYLGKRVGLEGKIFNQYKFRTMEHKVKGDHFTSKLDVRITPIGKLLRTFKLDEIPQFFNIIKGEMSLVGPRPEAVDVVMKNYKPSYYDVFSVRPGLTCTLQIRIFPDFTNTIPKGKDPTKYYNEVILPQRIQEDLDYVDSISFINDLSIIIKTINCIILEIFRYIKLSFK